MWIVNPLLMGAIKKIQLIFFFNMQLMLKNTKSYFQLEAKNKIVTSYQQNYLAINNKKKIHQSIGVSSKRVNYGNGRGS